MRIAVMTNWGIGARMLELLLPLSDVAFVVTRYEDSSTDPWRNVVRDVALANSVPILPEAGLDWETLSEAVRREKVEVVVMHAFMRKVPESVLAVPPRGFVNLHGSLLPRHKGADPVAYALAAGDELCGLTAHFATAEYDDGPIISQASFPLGKGDTRADVLEKQKDVLPDVIRETMARLQDSAFNAGEVA